MQVTFFGLLLFYVLMPAIAVADAKEELLKLEQEYIAAWNQGDAKSIQKHYHAVYTSFNLDQKLLSGLQDADQLQSSFKNGFSMSVRTRHLEVEIINGVAVTTGYLVGAISRSGDKNVNGTWRYSSIRVESNNSWLIVHNHLSELSSGVSETDNKMDE